VGTVDQKTLDFMAYVSDTLKAVIREVVKPGARIGDISSFIEKRLRAGGYRAVRELTGHGLGDTLHQFPDVPNVGKAGTGPTLPVGTMIAIEPIAVMGSEAVYTADDGWTVFTKDGSLACHFEHSILITETGYEVVV
jgi:methionyl aminopeptidase